MVLSDLKFTEASEGFSITMPRGVAIIPADGRTCMERVCGLEKSVCQVGKLKRKTSRREMQIKDSIMNLRLVLKKRRKSEALGLRGASWRNA